MARDPRLIAVHRGGLLDLTRHRLLAKWAAECAEHVLPLFAGTHPEDEGPRRAIDAACAWSRGDISVGEARDASVAAWWSANRLSQQSPYGDDSHHLNAAGVNPVPALREIRASVY